MNINPNKWSCLPTSICNVIGVPVGAFLKLLGHDGSDQPYPGSNVRAGFHMQECIDVLDLLGWSVTQFDMEIKMQGWVGGPCRTVKCRFGNEVRFRYHLARENGVIVGTMQDGDQDREIGHAVAWIKGKVYDPRGCGRVYEAQDLHLHRITPVTFYQMRKHV